MYNPKENKKYVGIIVDRNGPDNSCKVFLPEIHGINVSIDDLGWSRFTSSPDAGAGSTSFGTPDNGQMVTCTVNTTGGSTLVEINGLYQTKQTSSPSNAGNDSLNLVFPQWAAAIALTSNIRVPPETIQEQTVDGAKVRVPVERGTLHNHQLLMGINSTAAQPPLNGSILPTVSIGTAVQPSSMSAALSSLSSIMPSPASSLGSLFAGVIGQALAAILPPGLASSLTSTVGLMTTVQPSSTSFQVKPNTDVVIKNATRILSNARSTYEVNMGIREMLTNTSLQYESSRQITMPTSTDYGDADLTIDFANGTVSLTLSNAASAAMSAFSGMLSAIQGAEGEMFGNSASTIQTMGDRLVDEAKKTEFKVRTKDNASDTEGTPQRVLADQKALTFVAGSL